MTSSEGGWECIQSRFVARLCPSKDSCNICRGSRGASFQESRTSTDVLSDVFELAGLTCRSQVKTLGDTVVACTAERTRKCISITDEQKGIRWRCPERDQRHKELLTYFRRTSAGRYQCNFERFGNRTVHSCIPWRLATSDMCASSKNHYMHSPAPCASVVFVAAVERNE